ncbi:thiol-disulfide isomerase/thioredoxin [Natronobacillus azotifigens]|uniref:Redoxin domain-containing protein n=1 Tax=Natronobacillus azotifigens TaxID=472978 RepID=A0A9J6R7X5_9BACI|nr:redoxin domain-containing protein [Natronobacillus azotifigens]MCZ0701725.1 redoxin domain-containing protein [Natronobacillus azotifigens]
MKKNILLAIICVLFAWAIYDFYANEKQQLSVSEDISPKQNQANVEQNELAVGLQVGDIAPDFQLTTIDGESVVLSEYRGQRVMLNFWATWCPPCRAEMPDMERFYQEHDVTILAVNLTQTEESIEDIRQFVEDYNLTFMIPLDEENPSVSSTYEIRPIPTTFMIDSKGVIQQKSYGALNYEQMVHALNQMN